jgi:hypothetical protein
MRTLRPSVLNGAEDTRRQGVAATGLVLTFELMNAAIQNARLLGFVQVQVGPKVYALPVQAVHFERDGESNAAAGGFFTADDELHDYGILVDGDASESDVQAQIMKASMEAARHFSQKLLN